MLDSGVHDGALLPPPGQQGGVSTNRFERIRRIARLIAELGLPTRHRVTSTPSLFSVLEGCGGAILTQLCR